MNRLRREMTRFCEDVIGVYCGTRIHIQRGGLADQARHLLSQLKPKVSKAVKANRVRRVEKLDRQKIEMAELRRQAMARAQGLGELCLDPLTPGLEVLVHLNGGNGRRRQQQSIENCLIDHDECHKSVDKVPLQWLPEVQAWCARHGYPLPRRFHVLAALRGIEVPPTHRKPDHGPESAF